MRALKLINNTKEFLVIFIAICFLFSCSKQTVHTANTEIPPETTPNKLSQVISNNEREKYRAGITALYNSDFSEAQEIFNEFIQSRPELAGPYTNLALIQYKTNKLDKALEQVNKAIQLNPNQSQAYNLRAQIYIKNSKIHEAKADYLKAIEINPKYINAHYNLALLSDIYLQDILIAIKHYEIYLSLLKKPDTQTQEWLNHLRGTLKDA